MIDDTFANGAHPSWVRFCVGHAQIEMNQV